MEKNREHRNVTTLTQEKWSTEKEAKTHNEEKTAHPMNSDGKTGQIHAKESNRTSLSHHAQKATQNGLNT